MEIFYFITYSLLACAYLGWGLYGLCVNYNDDTPSGSLVAFGYALGQILFFPAYFIFRDSNTAVISLFLLATVANVAYTYRLRRHGISFLAGALARFKHGFPAYIVFVIVVVFAAIPYLVAGFGHYWQTANEDIFDGLNGRSAYIRNELIGNEASVNVATSTRDALSESLRVQTETSPEHDAKFFRERYVTDPGLLQYSSLAFFSVLMHSPVGVDAFLIQALLNLGLFAVGVYAFVRRVFNQPPVVAGIASILSAVGNFYLATYFNGHEGSLMYNAVAPFLLYFMVKWVRDRVPMGTWLIIPMVLTGMILGAYPYPMPFIIAPFIAYAALAWFARRSGDHEYSMIRLVSNRRILMAGLFLFSIVFIIAYVLAEPIRIRALSQFRSWGTMLNHVGLLQFWGIWPSSLAYTSTTIGWLNSHFDVKLASLFFAATLSAISIYGFFRLLKQNIGFVAIWVPIAIFLFFVMRFAVYDSYYIYKFVYINAWIVIAATVVGFWSLISKQFMPIRLIASGILSLWIVVNLTHNAYAFWQISQKPFNRDSASYFQLLEVPKQILAETYIAIPQQDHADLVRQMLGDNGIVTQNGKLYAKFVLNEVEIKDVVDESVGQTEWQSGRFVLSKRPDNDYIEFAAYWGPEAGQPDASGISQLFRWISDDRNGTVLIDLHGRSESSRYIYLCGESGLSVGFRTVEVSVFDADQKLAGVIPIGAYNCHWLDISNYRAPFSLTHHEQGQIVSAIDNRKFIYQIMHIGFSKTDTPEALPFKFTAAKDIVSLKNISVTAGGGVAILLGNGWYPIEEYGGESFRWVNTNAEIFISGSSSKGSLVIDAASGPSAGKETLQLSAVDAQGQIVGSCQLRERMKCSIPLTLDYTGKLRLLLRSDGEGHALSSDPRLLNFRVFNLEWKE